MIHLEHVTFEYEGGEFALEVPDLRVEAGEHVALVGPSGSGKTTLVNLIAGILPPGGGKVQVDGLDLGGLPDAERRRFRISRIGLVFQEFELLEYLSVADNIRLPYMINRALQLDAAAMRHLEELASSSGLGQKLARLPRALSHGERQRVAICRALVTRPALLIADEPTGNLDAATARRVLELMQNQARSVGATLLMVTHDQSLLSALDRTVDVGVFAHSGVAP